MMISVCDDNLNHLQAILEKLDHLPLCQGTSIQSYQDPQELLQALEDGALVDILIQDVEMKGINGIETARRINHINPACQIIFLTGYSQYVQDVYEVEHVYLVLKADAEERIECALKKAVEKWNCISSCVMRVQSGRRAYTVRSYDVPYLEHSGRRICVYTQKAAIWTYQTPQELLAQAEEGSFFQCHKSYYVNIRFIASWERTFFLLRDGTQVPISRPYQLSSKEWFFKNILLKV